MNLLRSAAYDEIAAWYQEQVARSWMHTLALPAMLSLLGNLEGKRVYDLGCGSGVFTRELARWGARPIGIDVSPQMLAYARAAEQSEATEATQSPGLF